MIVDVRMLLALFCGGNAQGIALVGFGQLFNLARHSCREEEGLALFRRVGKDEFQIFAETQVKHLISFIENRNFQPFQIQGAAFDMIAQTARRAHQNVAAMGEIAALAANIHAANAGGDMRTAVRHKAMSVRS